MNDDTRNSPSPETEARLRDALRARAETIEPSTDGLNEIEERLMDETKTNPTRTWALAVAGVAAAIIIGVVALVVTDEDDAPVATESTTTTTAATTTTADATTTTTEAPFSPDVDPYSVAYPAPGTSQRFDSPESAGAGYARDVLGFTELVVGEFRQGDSRSGEVPISDREGGIETIVLVRQMEDDTWFALGSQTEDIVVDTPAAGDDVVSPFDTSGEALAFEGTVTVVVRTQDDPALIGQGTVLGSGSPPAGPFEGSIEFDPPAADTPGILVYRVHSAEDGHVVQATSFPVRLLAV